MTSGVRPVGTQLWTCGVVRILCGSKTRRRMADLRYKSKKSFSSAPAETASGDATQVFGMQLKYPIIGHVCVCVARARARRSRYFVIRTQSVSFNCSNRRVLRRGRERLGANEWKSHRTSHGGREKPSNCYASVGRSRDCGTERYENFRLILQAEERHDVRLFEIHRWRRLVALANSVLGIF
jgi:hypothetical protein